MVPPAPREVPGAVDLPHMALPPCHVLFQLYVDVGARRLSCQVYQRAGDAFIGVPVNLAMYALLTHMIAQVTGYQAGELIHSFGDVHIYRSHERQVAEQLRRDPMPLPRLRLNPAIRELDRFRAEDCVLEGYEHHPPLAAKVAR
jgi:thymidylate synthase